MFQQAGILISSNKMVVHLLLSLSFVLITVDATCQNPSILYAQREVVAKRGDNVRLTVWIQNDGDESCPVTWFKFDNENRLKRLQSYNGASRSSPHPGAFVMSTHELNLRNVRRSETYRCKVQNGGFVDIHLRVVLSEDDISDASLGERTIVYMPRRIHVHEGESAGIVCMVRSEHVSSGDPFHWYKLDNSEPLRLSQTGGNYGNDNSYEYSNHMAIHILFVERTTTSDAGTYRCQLNDDVSRDTQLVVWPADSDYSSY